MLFPDLTPAPPGAPTSSDIVARVVPGALLVKAGSQPIGRAPRSGSDCFRRPIVIFVSGDSAPAKQAITDLFNDASSYPIDLGDLGSSNVTESA